MRSPPLLTGTVTAEVWTMMTPPVRKYGPAWRAGPSWISSVTLVKGLGSHPCLVSPESLRLLRDYLKDWLGYWRRNWGLLLWLGSAESDPRPQAGPTSGVNHTVVGEGHRGRAQLIKVVQGIDDCGNGTGNRVTARHRKAATAVTQEAKARARVCYKAGSGHGAAEPELTADD